MGSKNSVFQVLVTKGNVAPIEKDKTVSDLAVGQIGVFNDETGLSVDATNADAVRNFYIAVGADPAGTGSLSDVNFSAGQHIQKENVRDYTFRPHTASKPQIFEITDFDAECETDYTVRFEMRNIQILQRQGTTQFSKAYSVRTSCCGCDTSCPSGSSVELATLLYDVMNKDVSGMFKVELIEGPAGAVVSDVEAYKANPENAEAKPGLRITVNGGKVNDFLNINERQYNPRQTVVIPSLVDGFNCTGKITVTQQAVTEEGNGTDIKQREYFAGGWNGRPGPYRVSSTSGLAASGFQYYADGATKYDQVNLVYDHFSRAGFGEYLNNIFTTIAVPATDTNTRDGLVGILDVALSGKGFDPLADDAAAADPSPTVVEKTSKKGKDKDGVA